MYAQYPLSTAYVPLLDPLQTEEAIRRIKNRFQDLLAGALNLRRVTAPLFLPAGTGINDDLNGVERPVSFVVPHLNGLRAEIVQSLAKWKRMALADLSLSPGEGLYTDMNAIRPDERPDALHSLYVDQWDWEKVILAEERNLFYLQTTVRQIYAAMRQMEEELCAVYPQLSPLLPAEISFVTAQELEDRYPLLAVKERENQICRELGGVFVTGIGAPLRSGKPHDGRAPDYDDWSSANGQGQGLNGDILLWYPLLQCAVEISSMGIRVDREALLLQLSLSGNGERTKLFFHQRLLAGELPQSIGGGIGQSRLCLFYLRKAHIGEVQASIWPADMIADCRSRNIFLL